MYGAVGLLVEDTIVGVMYPDEELTMVGDKVGADVEATIIGLTRFADGTVVVITGLVVTP